MTPPAATGFLTYLGMAIRLELSRRSIEAAYGSKEVAHESVLQTLRKFKEERGLT
jgi:hypothetical protein